MDDWSNGPAAGFRPGSLILYEVALFGEFFSKDLKAIRERFGLHSESAQAMHCREILMEPLDAQQQRNAGLDPVMLRARKELLEPDSGWALYCFSKPEPTKLYSEATVRPWATVQVIGDALSFASAMGYVRRSQIYKRGYSFRRGPLLIQMCQQEQVDPRTQRPIPAHADTLWEVEVKNAQPARNTQERPLTALIQEVLKVQEFMKGLLDLRRQDL
ncbi:hypothetical protein NEOLEDRAFT_1159164 [Neolentinus lepideus HHB14362 ss-1]|uniref:Mediator of RNA polymerase II transcription subunit 18 n=1 Tax=Neolentinus lepideus HHB14362 ss-1 TaxID=1314782 RepID=A0A165N804_9AGAM|nr:hypothetical protein NEOLEDRAFT_1159164 [Neolentinus lepideus HHB14362 ss-1]